MTLSDFSANRLDGTWQNLADYSGKVALIVNVASQCGFTPQYRGLEGLWRAHREAGLVVLGFPCNQFGGQEPGAAGDIAAFCAENYDVTFPLFEKIDVNGPGALPLFKWLKHAAPGFFGFNDIKWNFTKFLIDRQGRAVRRYAPTTEPRDIVKGIDKLL
ncbi:MAG: glutathione peroxidase [Cucumibacter sp.]